MSRPVMVDSSWYISQARLGKDPLKELALAAVDRDIAVCGLIVTEVGRGIRERRFLERYLQAWAQMLYVPSTLADNLTNRTFHSCIYPYGGTNQHMGTRSKGWTLQDRSGF